MKKAAKILVFIVIGLFVVAGVLVSYVKFALPNVGPAPDLKVEITPERIERGKYLANHVTVCVDCHSSRDWTKFSGPYDSARAGSGGEKFDKNVGFPGEVTSPNITPYHLKDWTDGEIFRAITTGVKKDGSAIFPIMPYRSYGKMDKEDIYAIIAYIRTLKEVESSYGERKLDFPLNFLVNTMPAEASLQEIPSPDNPVAYGAYLVNAAACGECHTKKEKGAPVPGMEFAGGESFSSPTATMYSANITPDPATGIGNWTKEQFVARFTMHADSSYQPANVGPRDFQTIMPWLMYGGMEPGDLEAMYAYLKTVKPVKHQVTRLVEK